MGCRIGKPIQLAALAAGLKAARASPLLLEKAKPVSKAEPCVRPGVVAPGGMEKRAAKWFQLFTDRAIEVPSSPRCSLLECV